MAEILLIDDVPVVRTVLAKFISREGHVVTQCDGGHEAWALLRQQPFDLVVTDLRMKGGDGLDFIQRARTHGYPTPIIAMTGADANSPHDDSERLALGAGADRVLFKPVARMVLLDAIARLLGAAFARSEDIPGRSGRPIAETAVQATRPDDG